MAFQSYRLQRRQLEELVINTSEVRVCLCLLYQENICDEKRLDTVVGLVHGLLRSLLFITQSAIHMIPMINVIGVK